ncbi:MAG: hypothetical protein JXD22_02635 [Sedimentisphaerales bacterium]|nr:hypothetical protein [Sedimentisphaerales bacterium]
MEVLEHIPFNLDIDALLSKLRIDQRPNDIKRFQNLVDQLTPQANPKALYTVSFIESRSHDTVTIDNVTFTSRALRTKLDKIQRVFPCIVTCGRELDNLNLDPDDFVKNFWLDTLKEQILRHASTHLNNHLKQKFALTRIASMSPGSADKYVWPIEQQIQLFSIFPHAKKQIGVQLTQSCLMIPIKSVSSIRFPSEFDFHTCQLCHKQNCPSRKAPFDQHTWDSLI